MTSSFQAYVFFVCFFIYIASDAFYSMHFNILECVFCYSSWYF